MDARPSPSRIAGSKLLVSTFWPKFVFDITPQRSPPLAREGPARPDSADRNRARSCRSRRSRRASRPRCRTPTSSAASAASDWCWRKCPRHRRPRGTCRALTLSAVLPVPNRSYGGAQPRREVLVAVDADGFRDDDRRRQEAGGPFLLGGNQLRARSNRTAPCSVTRSRVHWSWANSASQAARASFTHGEIDCVSWFGTPLSTR